MTGSKKTNKQKKKPQRSHLFLHHADDLDLEVLQGLLVLRGEQVLSGVPSMQLSHTVGNKICSVRLPRNFQLSG